MEMRDCKLSHHLDSPVSNIFSQAFLGNQPLRYIFFKSNIPGLRDEILRENAAYWRRRLWRYETVIPCTSPLIRRHGLFRPFISPRKRSMHFWGHATFERNQIFSHFPLTRLWLQEQDKLQDAQLQSIVRRK